MRFYTKDGRICKTYLEVIMKDTQDKISEVKKKFSKHKSTCVDSSGDESEDSDDVSDPRYENAKVELNSRTNTIDIVGRSSGELLDSYSYWTPMNDCKNGSSINELTMDINVDESDDD